MHPCYLCELKLSLEAMRTKIGEKDTEGGKVKSVMSAAASHLYARAVTTPAGPFYIPPEALFIWTKQIQTEAVGLVVHLHV